MVKLLSNWFLPPTLWHSPPPFSAFSAGSYTLVVTKAGFGQRGRLAMVALSGLVAFHNAAARRNRRVPCQGVGTAQGVTVVTVVVGVGTDWGCIFRWMS